MNMQTHNQVNDFTKWLGDRLWIIASGSLDRFPQDGCHCRLCEISRKGGKDKRLPASSIFYKGYLFDIGPGVWKRIKQREIEPKAIILSHVHWDHIADLADHVVISKRFKIYCSVLYKGMMEKLGVKAHYFEPDSSFKIGEDKFESKTGIHTYTRPVSLIKFNNLIYAPDTGDITLSDLLWSKGAETWIGDGFSIDENFVVNNQKLHMSVQELLKKLKKIKSLKRVVFLGVGHASKYPHEDYEILLRQFANKQNLHFSVEIGWDNLIMKL